MAKKKAAPKDELAAELAPKAQLTSLELGELHFQRRGLWPQAGDSGYDVDTRFGIQAVRIGPGELGVKFELSMKLPDVFELMVSYRMTFTAPAPQGIGEVQFFQRVAARVAPIVAFPYIRESIASITAKAGATSPVLLPIMNVGAMFQPESLKILEVDDENGNDNE